MSDPIFPLEVWEEGTLQNDVPANTNSLRVEAILRGALSVANSPGVSTDGTVYIVGSAPTGAFSTFDEDDLTIYYGGTWYAWAPVDGLVVYIGDIPYQWDSGWTDVSGGGGSTNQFVNIAMSDMTTDLTTGAAKAAWFAPENGELVSVYIAVHDPSSSGVVRVDMNDTGGSVFTTRPAIDATEATSLTGTAAVLDGTVTFSRGDKFTFDIDDAGTDAKGLQVCVEYAPA